MVALHLLTVSPAKAPLLPFASESHAAFRAERDAIVRKFRNEDDRRYCTLLIARLDRPEGRALAIALHEDVVTGRESVEASVEEFLRCGKVELYVLVPTRILAARFMGRRGVAAALAGRPKSEHVRVMRAGDDVEVCELPMHDGAAPANDV